MRNVLLATGLVTCLVTASPAAAHPTYHYAGGCGYLTLSDGTDSDDTRWDGEANAVVVATASDSVTPAPTVPIAVECRLYVDSVFRQTIASATGAGAAAAVNAPFAFYADPDAVVTLCEVVTVGGDGHEDCSPSADTDWEYLTYPPDLPPELDPVEGYLRCVYSWWCSLLDVLVCDGSYPDVPGVVEVRDDGDIYVAGEWIWDCPPYGT